MNDLRSEFQRLEKEGYLGDPEGEDAYAYLRASSERQVEQGSSFTRQIENIHLTAERDGLRVSLTHIYFDDGYTGFEFEHRPALLKLRHEVATKKRAGHLIIEDIDRLSRNADWQQGFLLEEFARHEVEVHFFINPGSQLERYVRGYIAQEGMKKDRERMRMGVIYKAMSGKVTAKRPLFGYKITHPQESYYEINPEEAEIVRLMFETLIEKGWSVQKIAQYLNDNHIPTKFTGGVWAASTIYRLFKNPVYKGKFYANKHLQEITGHRENGKPKRSSKLRPKEEWIEVPVPPIVTEAEWELAQEILKKNAKTSTRNSKKGEWLLSGFTRCGICRVFTLSAIVGGTKNTRIRYYGCYSSSSEKSRLKTSPCRSPYIHADLLERRVWEEIEQVIYNPKRILKRLEEREKEKEQEDTGKQIEFVDRQVAGLDKEKEKLEAAYNRDIYTLDEFSEKMKNLKARKKALIDSRKRLEERLAEIHNFEEQKKIVLAALTKVKQEIERAKEESRPSREIPFELKRRILSLLVKVIWVNTVERTFEIVGEIKGSYSIDDADFAFTSARIWR